MIAQCSYPILREATVVSVADPKSLGRAQLKVLPELQKIADEDCPWAFPIGAGAQGKDFALPPAQSVVYAIVFNRFWNEIAFIPSVVPSPREHLFGAWMNERKSSITDMKCEPEESFFAVKEWADGFSEYHDTKNSEHGFLHPSGTFVTIDKDGNVSMQAVKRLIIHDKEGNVTVTADASTGDVSVKAAGKVDIESPATTLKGGDVTINGTVTPNGTGALCGLPFCMFSGAAHAGSTAKQCQ